MIVDIIITSQTKPSHIDMVRNCIYSLRLSEPVIKFNVIVIESYGYQDVGQDKTVSYTESEYNCHRALKLGLKECHNEWVGIFNNDLVFYWAWMTEILRAHAARPDIESFSPWNEKYQWHPVRVLNRTWINEGYQIGIHIAGWAIITKTAIIKALPLNERCDFWYSDNIYADELQERKIKHALIATSRVDHLLSQTNPVSNEQALVDQRRYFDGLVQSTYDRSLR